MIKLPKSLKAHGRRAQELQRHLDEVIFSGPTYQLHFSDPEIQDGAWAFIQLNEQGKLKDCFCSCDSGDAHNGCYHVAAAYLAIYGGSHLPLHIRFEKSLWNRICTIYSHKVGFSPHAMTHPAPDLFTAYSHSGKLLFEAHANSSSGREFLEQLFLERSPETEESSLKFSNLPEIELKLWRQGRPSIHMLYLLSCWNDLARWMLMQQIREEPYTIQFNSPEEGIPNHLHLKFPDISLSFYLSETNLVEIIPSLNDVNSPLKLLNVQDTQIDRICFDPQQCVLNIHHNRQSVSQSPCKMDGAIPLLDPTGDNVPRWFYLPGKGFIHHAGEGLLDRHKLEPSEIAPFLDKHTDLIREKLEGISLQEKPIDPSFHLHFDDGENLHIETFLFERGDLTSPDNHFFGSWAYIHGDGFFRLHPPPFDKPNVTIARDRVDRFVTEERSWLVNQPGFVPHIVPIESELTYQLSPEGTLEILSDTHLPTESSLRQIHFNSWIYIEPHGFFSRVCRYRDLVVRPGLRIPKQQVSTFLRMHCDELEHISDFFASTSPISSCQFSLDIDREERLVLKAHYPLKEEYEDRSLIWFDEWVYAPGEGFSRLPIDPELERFTMGKRIFEASDIDLFLEKEWELLGKTLTLDTPRLIPTAEGEWVARQIVPSEERDEGGVEMLVDYVTPQGVLSARELWRALSGDRRYYPSRIGLIDLQAPAFRWLRQLPLGRLDSSDEHLSLTHLEAVRLIATLDIDIDKTLENGKVAESILGLISRSEFPLPPLTGFKSELRPYQEMGVRWLWHLYHHNLSGLLCDDMGLGKTHQAMALICGVYNTLLKHQGEAPPPLFLVVCPTSVIYHWNEKCRKIFPDLSIEVYHGPQRSLTCIKRCDLLITSYGIVRSDIQQLKEIPFTVVLLDEIQVAKNHLSGLYRALKKLTADMVVGLTGTPIENHLRELKTLFDLVLPGYMPDETAYREHFIKPIERDPGSERKHLLNRLVQPFVMRRKKEDVLDDLPEKTEEIAHCELTSEQHLLYQRAVIEQNALKEALRDSSQPIPYLHVFALLTSLKQICNHPALYLKEPENYVKHPSGKWNLFIELLHEALDSSQKVVVFTQYLQMLDIFELYLQQQEIPYAVIRGSTKERGAELERFNQDPNCKVFLGSLQAVGLGIDLTAASVVIHYDRWWNAAREEQATDRVHRIGQQRGVQVFKLVTLGTFEERIDEMIRQKGGLMEDVIGTDQRDLFKKLSREEILNLLKIEF